MGFQWMHKCIIGGQIVKRIMKKRRPGNLHMKITKQGETQPLQSLIFESPPTWNRSFSFSRFVEDVFQMFKTPLNWGLRVPLAPKWQERGFKTHTTTKHQKSRKI